MFPVQLLVVPRSSRFYPPSGTSCGLPASLRLNIGISPSSQESVASSSNRPPTMHKQRPTRLRRRIEFPTTTVDDREFESPLFPKTEDIGIHSPTLHSPSTSITPSPQKPVALVRVVLRCRSEALTDPRRPGPRGRLGGRRPSYSQPGLGDVPTVSGCRQSCWRQLAPPLPPVDVVFVDRRRTGIRHGGGGRGGVKGGGGVRIRS